MLTRLRPLRDLVWPASCASCGLAGQVLCVRCAASIAWLGAPGWHVPDPCPTSFPPTIAWGRYDGALRRLVVAYKDADRVDAGPLLAAPLGTVIGRALDGLERPVLVPIPSSAASRRTRGREPLLDVLRRVEVARPIPIVPVLHHHRRVRDQARLTHLERRDNLHGSLGVRPGWATTLRSADVILIDDVVTTGATLAEATRAILEHPEAGPVVSSVCAAVICATQRIGQTGS